MLSLAFILIVIAAICTFFFAAAWNRKIVLFQLMWAALIGILAFNNFFEDIDAIPPRFLLVFAGILWMILYYYRVLKDSRGRLEALLLIHALRLPVELCLEHLYQQKMIPKIMTYHGWNFDILMGISALLIWILYKAGKITLHSKVILAWNILGICLLSVIVTLAILSSPLPFQILAFEQPNIAVLQFPYIFLPACIVPIVFLSHVLAIRKIKHLIKGRAFL